MTKPTPIKMNSVTRQLLMSVFLLTIFGIAIASTGGGKEKKATPKYPFKSSFTPIRTNNGFTLKAGPSFSGSYFQSQQRDRNGLSINMVSTYQKGNTLFVLPYKYKVSTSPYLNLSSRTNLQVLDLKIQMHK
jgi:hypothetical protein